MSIKSMVFHSGFRLSMTHCSDNGLVFAERFRNFAKSEKVFKAECHKAWEENICLKEEDPMKSMDPSTYVPRVLCALAG